MLGLLEASVVGGAGAEPKLAREDPLIPKTRALAQANKLLASADFEALKKAPRPEPVALPAVLTRPLAGRELAARAARAYLRAGWIYRCSKCSQWHLTLAGGYAIARDTVVTAWHVMATPDKMKPGEGWPVIVQGEAEILPIVSVLAGSEAADTIILRVAPGDLRPLPLSGGAQVGDAAYCFSDPHDAHGYFSSGIVNRFFSRSGGAADNPGDRRFNVSTDWAPGSSGAAVLDECGNAIGHVARIQALHDKKQAAESGGNHEESASTIMTLHEAVSAKAVLSLIEKLR